MNEVVLPPWALNEHDFIRINREILDSQYVKKHLPFWLDLTFGQKQRSPEHCNVFYSFAYEVRF